MTQTTLLLIVLAVVIVVGFIVISRKPNARHPSDEVTPPVVEPDRDPGNVSPNDKINGS